LYAEKTVSLFLLYNCGTVAVAPRCVAEAETLYLAYTLDFSALLQKLQINTIHLLLVTKYTFMRVENSVSISHILLSSAEASRAPGCPPNAKSRAEARTHFFNNHGGNNYGK